MASRGLALADPVMNAREPMVPDGSTHIHV
jgi:hypothetical protein